MVRFEGAMRNAQNHGLEELTLELSQMFWGYESKIICVNRQIGNYYAEIYLYILTSSERIPKSSNGC